MNHDRAVELVAIENNDSVKCRRDALRRAQYLLDKGAREEAGPGGKPNNVGIATVDGVNRIR